MNETEFEIFAAATGHVSGEIKVYEPNMTSAPREHSVSTLVLVTEGSLRLVYTDREVMLKPGDWTDMPCGVTHYECAGPDGAEVLLAAQSGAAIATATAS